MAKQGMIYNRKVIAQMLCISEKRVKQLTEEGIIEEFSDGHYQMRPAVQGYIRYLQSIVANNEGREKERESHKSGYDAEREKLTRIKREDAELDLQVKRNEWHHASRVKFLVTNSLMALKAKLETLPYKILPQLMGVQDGAEKSEIVLALLKKSIAETLEELSAYDPAEYADEKAVVFTAGELDGEDE